MKISCVAFGAGLSHLEIPPLWTILSVSIKVCILETATRSNESEGALQISEEKRRCFSGEQTTSYESVHGPQEDLCLHNGLQSMVDRVPQKREDSQP